MEHYFNTEIADKYGIEEAIIIHNFFHWIRKNVVNRSNYYDGRYWTYNTTKSYGDLFTYMSQSKISRSINKLVKCGVLVKGNYNKQPFDRTCWYAFSDMAITYMQNVGMDLYKMKNGRLQSDLTIPDINTYNKPNNNKEDTIVSKKDEVWRTDFDAYLSIVLLAKATLAGDSDFRTKMEKYHQNVDYELSVEKAVDMFWGTEMGWENKRKSKAKSIDMVATLKKNFDKNIVYKRFSKYGDEPTNPQTEGDRMCRFENDLSGAKMTGKYSLYKTWCNMNGEENIIFHGFID